MIYTAVYGITHSALFVFEKGKTMKDVAVVMHVPPKVGSFKNFPSSEAFPVTTATDKKFIADLRKAGNVKLVMVSHIHDRLLLGVPPPHYNITGVFDTGLPNTNVTEKLSLFIYFP